MKNFTLSALAASLLLVSGGAFALLPTTSTFTSPTTQWSDDDAETIVFGPDHDFGPGGTDVSLQVGDYLVGILSFTSYPNKTGATDSALYNEFGGIFASEVKSVTPVPGALIPAVCGSAVLTSCSAFEFQGITGGLGVAIAALEAQYGLDLSAIAGDVAANPNAQFLMYEDTTGTKNFNRQGTLQEGFDTATDGTLRLTAGLDTGVDPADAWNGVGPADLTEIASVAPGAKTGAYNIDMTVLSQSFPGSSVLGPDIQVSGNIYNPDQAINPLVNFPAWTDTTWFLPTTLVPEPDALALFSVGLIGLFANRRLGAKK